MMFCFNQCNCH